MSFGDIKHPRKLNVKAKSCIKNEAVNDVNTTKEISPILYYNSGKGTLRAR